MSRKLSLYPTLIGYSTRGAGANRTESFSTIRNGSADYTGYSTTPNTGQQRLLSTLEARSGSSNNFSTLVRGYIFYDTSAIPKGVIITDARIKFVTDIDNTNKSTALGDTGFDITGVTTANNNSIISADHNPANFSSTVLATRNISTMPSTNTTYDLILNQAGINYINRNGITKFAARLSWDRTGSFTGNWVTGGARTSISSRTYYDGEFNPLPSEMKLEITYTLKGNFLSFLV